MQRVTIRHYHILDDNVLFLTIYPINYLQDCHCYHSQEFVISKDGRKTLRQVRNLRCFNYENIFLLSLKHRLCKQCQFLITYQ